MNWQDPIYKGATRPAMAFGVPFVPLVIVIGSILWISGATTMFVALAIPPVVLAMGSITRTDDQAFRLLGLRLQFRARMRTTRYWRSGTLAPISFRPTR